MRRVKRVFLFVATTALAGSGIVAIAACATSESSAAPVIPSDAKDANERATPARPAAKDGAADDADGSALSTCDLTRQYVSLCGKPNDLTCGTAKFDAWCALQDETMNSEAFRHAEQACLTSANCDGLDRRDCEYRTYATEPRTEAQNRLVAAYCQTCEANDLVGCAVRKTTYDPAKGPKSTDDVFVAAWELSDTLVTEIRNRCTGPDRDAGPDASDDAGTDACLRQFAKCAGDIYVNHLPDCPQ